MNNHYDRNTNTQQDALKNIQANSVSIGSINQNIQHLLKLQPQPESEINSRSQLIKYLRGEVERWKDDYLYNNEWLEPPLQERNELVAPSYSKEKGIPGKSHSQQLLTINIKDFFKKEKINGRLLILGNPGAGKTAAKMQLAEELIICAENNYSEPLPFWFDLSSWNEQPLEKWLIAELYFLIENIQPSWLENKNQKMRYRLFIVLTIILLSLPISLILSALMLVAFKQAELRGVIKEVINIEIVFISLLTSISLATTVELLGLTKEIKPVETLKLPGHELINALKLVHFRERFVAAISLSFTQPIPVNDNSKQVIPFIQQYAYTLFGSINSVIGLIFRGLFGWLIPPIAFLRGLLAALTGPNIDIKKRAVPNQGIYKSLFNIVPLGLIFGSIGLLGGVGFKLYEAYLNDAFKYVYNVNNISFGLFCASIGALLGIMYAGLPVIQHFALRFVLYQDGLIPFRFADFLEHTNKYRLTQRYGGRYSFIHDLLREYFVNLAPDESKK